MENFGTDLISKEVLSKFKIKILSINSLDITDEVYFSDKYSNYISNSKLKLINPDEGGSFKTYLEGLKSKSTGSLDLGSAVHELVLQNESFELNSYIKPSGKIGKVIHRVSVGFAEYRLESACSKSASTLFIPGKEFAPLWDSPTTTQHP